MMTFDMTPLFKAGYKKFLILPAILGVLLAASAYIMGSPEWGLALFRGVVLGILDAVIMVAGIRKAIPYEKEPKKGLAIMRRYRMYRLLAVSSVIILLLRQGSAVAGVCIGLLLTHIFFIINLIIIAYRLNKVET